MTVSTTITLIFKIKPTKYILTRYFDKNGKLKYIDQNETNQYININVWMSSLANWCL